MLNAAKVLAGGAAGRINNSEELERWLQKQPPEVVAAFAARVALRVLPIVRDARIGAFRGDFYAAIVLSVFRAMVVSWAAAKYPAHKPQITVAAYADNGARFAAYAAGNDAAHAGAAAARDTAFAAYYALHMDATGAAHAATYAASAFADADAASAATAHWSAVSIDATRVEEGAKASVIAGSPLWPLHPLGPEPLASLWQDMKAALLAEKQDWQVWTIWYDDRLAGYPFREEERELAYVRIEEALWKQGPAIVNAEIKRRIEADTVLDLRHPDITGASNVAANQASRVGAAEAGIAGSRRPVFKGFFSYTHRDAEVDPHIVEAYSSELEKRVDAKLVNARFEIWRDKEKLRVGDYWDKNIKGAIDSSDIFIVVLTPKWISSDYCRKEFEAFEKIKSARDSGGYVIPIYARDIERQAKFLEPEQKQLSDRLKRIQYQQVIPKQFAP